MGASTALKWCRAPRRPETPPNSAVSFNSAEAYPTASAAVLAVAISRARDLLVRSVSEGAAARDLARFFDPGVADRIRSAAMAVRAGEGEAFVAAGVEAVSRFMVGGSSDHTPNTQNPTFQDAGLRTLARMAGDQGDWTPPTGLPDVYIAMGETAENVAEVEGVTREEMDDYAFRSQQRTDDHVTTGLELTVALHHDAIKIGRASCRERV